ncbi:UNVERIFIED_CONTAM: hypothetical protein GTU68_031022 [Idotea baltica]|nr:hypothetical protein [Idotea baltica]
MIMAASENGVIGKDNNLPWHLPDDFKYFKRTTSGHSVIMGRKTYQSLGKALPKRRNIVITRDESLALPDAEIVHSLVDALKLCVGEEEVFVIGGGTIYELALELDLADKILITVVHTQLEGDTYFRIPAQGWQLTSSEAHEKDDRHVYPFTFEVHERIN